MPCIRHAGDEASCISSDVGAVPRQNYAFRNGTLQSMQMVCLISNELRDTRTSVQDSRHRVCTTAFFCSARVGTYPLALYVVER